eukprot:scaffold1803_cov92-Amphora_coffeaeformis.AAC.55
MRGNGRTRVVPIAVFNGRKEMRQRQASRKRRRTLYLSTKRVIVDMSCTGLWPCLQFRTHDAMILAFVTEKVLVGCARKGGIVIATHQRDCFVLCYTIDAFTLVHSSMRGVEAVLVDVRNICWDCRTVRNGGLYANEFTTTEDHPEYQQVTDKRQRTIASFGDHDLPMDICQIRRSKSQVSPQEEHLIHCRA